MSDTLKNRLREEMNNQGLRQIDLAEKTGFSKPIISQWLHGKHEVSADNLCILAKALNVSESWLMGNDVPKTYDREELEKKLEICNLLEKCYGSKAYELVELFSQFNELGKKKIIEEMTDMLQLPKYTESQKKEKLS